MPEPFLHCATEVQAGAIALDARFSLAAPWTCLFGASGSGKTTLLRVLAGHLRPARGQIRFPNGRVLLDTAARIDVPAHTRPFRSSPQKAWLFPGSVRDNLRYGMTAVSGRTIEDEVLALFDLHEVARQSARSLSGGQQQRVSLARTIASALGTAEPVSLLLLDEPFTGLDLAARNSLAFRLRAFLRERNLPVLSVTHDLPEVLLLEAEVLRLKDGCIAAQGPAPEVLAAERALLTGTLGAFPTSTR